MGKANIIETTSDLQMTVSRAKVNSIHGHFKVRQPDEIAFLIHGFDPSIDKEVESVATISKDEAKRLVNILTELITE